MFALRPWLRATEATLALLARAQSLALLERAQSEEGEEKEHQRNDETEERGQHQQRNEPSERRPQADHARETRLEAGCFEPVGGPAGLKPATTPL